MGKSSIEWTGETWNPVRGCIKVSPGCKHCYAETFAERWRGTPGHPYEQGFDPMLVPHKLGEPLTWREPSNVFVNSMSDLFGEFVPDEYIAAVFGVMAAAHWHTFQVLTKRAERLLRWFGWAVSRFTRSGWRMEPWEVISDEAASILPERCKFPPMFAAPWPLPNVHLGVSVEDRKHGLPRIDHLRRAPAALRFLSIEPLLEDLGEIDLTGIGWVIAGAESGRRNRPMEDDWVRSIRDQCTAAGVPFFFKQRATRSGKKLSLPILDGRTWEQMP